jgi:hypothetical protein
VRWRHRTPTGHAPQQALEQCPELVTDQRAAVATVALKHHLHSLPDIGVDDGQLFAAM